MLADPPEPCVPPAIANICSATFPPLNYYKLSF